MSEVGCTSIEKLPVNPQMSMIQTESIAISPPAQQQMGQEMTNVKLPNYGQHIIEHNNNPAEPIMQNIDYGAQLNPVLKTAAESGATVLPSRDIPQNTLPIQQDNTVKPNYIPESKNEDYIGDILNKEKILEENRIKQNRSESMDYIFSQIQIPLLIALIYFMFQLPIFRNTLLKIFPKLFNKDGNSNIYGYIFNSTLFALLYYILIKSLEYVNH